MQLAWDISQSTAIGDGYRTRLMDKLGPVVRADVDDHRSQQRNREAAAERLGDKVRGALVRQAPRRATKPTKGSKRRRVEAKRRKSQTKAMRKKPNRWD